MQWSATWCLSGKIFFLNPVILSLVLHTPWKCSHFHQIKGTVSRDRYLFNQYFLCMRWWFSRSYKLFTTLYNYLLIICFFASAIFQRWSKLFSYRSVHDFFWLVETSVFCKLPNVCSYTVYYVTRISQSYIYISRRKKVVSNAIVSKLK